MDIGRATSHSCASIQLMFLLLIKVCIPCTQRVYPQPLIFPRLTFCLWLEHDDAISRVDDLIDTVQFNSISYVVQARAHALPRGEYHH